ncbi:endo-1,3-alpha-glucanase family glycosylhydrolase [Paraglaciecola sp. 2405UD69-4]|uniref:endo-1,3-alpha-glucanase family glycosylhydrolase n=1 Tax=Paraglaciecola sp. 2405UD69-4 TaxID=3391836 RepID=UPI0039C941CE
MKLLDFYQVHNTKLCKPLVKLVSLILTTIVFSACGGGADSLAEDSGVAEPVVIVESESKIEEVENIQSEELTVSDDTLSQELESPTTQVPVIVATPEVPKTEATIEERDSTDVIGSVNNSTEGSSDNDVVEDAENAVVEDAENAVVEDAENAVVEDAESGVVEDAESDVVEDAENAVVEDAENAEVEDAESDVVEDAESGVVEDAENAEVEDADSDVVEDAESGVVEDAESDVVEDAESDVVEDAESDVVEDAENDVVEDAENDVVEDAENDVVEDAESGVVEDAENDVVEDAESGVVENAENDVVEDAENDVVEDAENDVVEDAENDVVEDAESDVVEDAENDVVEDAENDVVEDAEQTEGFPLIISSTPQHDSLDNSNGRELMFTFDRDVSSYTFTVKIESNLGEVISNKVSTSGTSLFVNTDTFLQFDTTYNVTFIVDSIATTQEITFTTKSADFKGFTPIQSTTNAGNEKLVFAHYFTPYVPMINNRLPGEDYYDLHYLNPYGESSKFLEKGGLLRERPIARAPFTDDLDWKVADATHEVRQAAAIGIDGFSMNILATSGFHWDRIERIYNAAEELGDFKLLIMPDMSARFSNYPEEFVPMIQLLAERSASYRLDDGRLVISPYLAEKQSPTWWKEVLDELKGLGIQVALVPLYQGWSSDLATFKEEEPEAYEEYVYGVSDWGSRSPTSAYGLEAVADKAHEESKIWMAPVSPQDHRPKSLIYTEAGNSETYRTMWESAINGNSDWVQIITWNDYSETTEIKPSTQSGYAFYDLTAFYIEWFKTEEIPDVNQDAMYAFYREHSTEALLSGEVQTRTLTSVNGETPRNEIELLAFLKEQATLEITIAGEVYQQSFNAGMASYKVPLSEGTPEFKIIRNDIVVKHMFGEFEINNNIDIQDLSYRGSSSLRPALESNSLHLSWPTKIIPESSSQIKNAESTSPYVRNGNAAASMFTFDNQYTDDGFTYEFIEINDGSQTTISFDINLEDTCIKTSNLTMNLTDSENIPGIVLQLCNGTYDTSELVNIGNNEEVLFGTQLLANTWYKIDITTNYIGNNYSSYNLVLTMPDGSTSTHYDLPLQNSLETLRAIEFKLENVVTPTFNILVDNVSVSKL